jgi:hypothetical protein
VYAKTIGLWALRNFIQVYVMTIGHLVQRIHIIKVHITLAKIYGLTEEEVLEVEWSRFQRHGNQEESAAQQKLTSPPRVAGRCIFADRSCGICPLWRAGGGI